jgi:hypothetical protein
MATSQALLHSSPRQIREERPSEFRFESSARNATRLRGEPRPVEKRGPSPRAHILHTFTAYRTSWASVTLAQEVLVL